MRLEEVLAAKDGQVLERRWKRGKGFALRFRAYGERRYTTLGLESEGWSRERAEEELQNVLADVRRGIWVPPQRARRLRRDEALGEGTQSQVFGPFARALLAARKGQSSEAMDRYLEWGLSHVLPYFAKWRLDEIDVRAVDSFRAYKVEESEMRRRAIDAGNPMTDRGGKALRPLSPSSINKAIDTLQWVLSHAVEYELIERNPAVGRRRRLRAEKRPPVHLDTVTRIRALLDAAEALDRDRRWPITDRQVIIATLLFAGPRASELTHLRWRGVDLANGRLQIGRSKTQAGLREINLLPILRDQLASHQAAAKLTGPEEPVFPNRAGGPRDKDNIRNRILLPTIERANRLLEERSQPPLPEGLTSHKLRHTFASILVALGEDPVSVMTQLGHTDPSFTLRVYSHMMRRDANERARLRALVNGETSPESEALSTIA
jgi:integrase